MSITAAYSHKIDEIYASDFASHQQNGLDQITHLQGSRKRPHVEVDAGQQDWQPFSIQTIPNDRSKADVHTLTPHFILPRTRLALNYLDPSGCQDGVSSQALFFAQISLLEQSVQDEQPLSPIIMIARSDRTKRYLVIEKISEWIYMLCTMCRWVSYGDVNRLHQFSLSSHHLAGPSICLMPDNDETTWWKFAAVTSHLPSSKAHWDSPDSQDIASCKLALRTLPEDGLSLSLANEINCVPIELGQFDAERTLEDGSGVQNFEELSKTIKNQYQEALYISRSSLAYFAKGPLSRARANYHVNRNSEHDFQDLTQCLRAMILPLSAMDIKYRESLPKLIEDLPYSPLSDDEIWPLIEIIKSKRRRSKKEKIGKDGLFPDESPKIAQWWLSRDSPDSKCDTEEAREHHLKTILLAQRARETQLQIILALEILALEASALGSTAKSRVTDVHMIEEQHTKNIKKAKKPQDLYMLLDILADRLCIWQTMSLQPVDPSKLDQASGTGSKNSAGESALANDSLQQFCVDVVLPFYGARCPQLSKSICQKLGGTLSPKRRDLAPATESAEAQSAEARTIPSSLKAQSKRRPRRTLERVMTDDKLKLRPPACLSRSATEPVLPRIKREVSDVSLPPVLSSRVAMSKRFSQREVDIQGASQASAMKSQKAAVEQELRGAIATLKRPNPRLAVREVVDAADDRRINSHPRKIRKPQRNPFAQDLQIMATPSKHRTSAGHRILPNQKAGSQYEDVDELPSSVTRIPCSAIKCGQSVVAGRQKPGRSEMASTTLIDQTPTKKSMKPLSQSSAVCTHRADSTGDTQLPQAPSPPRPAKLSRSFGGRDSLSTFSITASLAGPDEQDLPPTTHSQRRGQLISSNERVHPPEARPLRSSTPNFDEEPAIYANLGWTYDFDE